MTQHAEFQDVPTDAFDAIARDLQTLRIEAGDVPYAEIVRRIGKLRELCGVDAVAARPARTTVYDAFRLGRTRINAELVGEIVQALGCSPEEAKTWERRCLQARLDKAAARQPSPAAPQPSPAAPTVHIVSTLGQENTAPSRRRIYILLSACLMLNLAGFWLVDAAGLRLYMDMIGTALAAIACGPWAGVLVGLATNIIGLSITDSSAAAFGLVNMTGALVWGYGAKLIKRNSALPKYVLLNVVVAVACSVVSSIILVLLFGGMTGHASETTMQSILASTSSLGLAVFEANLMYSLVDKLLTGFIVIALLGLVKQWIRVPVYEHVSEHALESLDRAYRLTKTGFGSLRAHQGRALG
ncbi:hypothetical protein C1H84_16650 [Glutamicibacter soli]|uniref:ECF transporter S component n=1 Tax=Glutamicibacter soli TaxID=453836 RepID=A0A365Y8S8_9MICC|nr:ECF transporter S component [Glutamicibacter soli]RBL99070.1 hypothetical protein C1H84_16650 [Glutamicibacter soli]